MSVDGLEILGIYETLSAYVGENNNRALKLSLLTRQLTLSTLPRCFLDLASILGVP